MTATITKSSIKVGDVIDTMRDIQSENDLWELAEELGVLIPSGTGDSKGVTFGKIVDQATQEGVAGKFSATTLRIYRDVAKRWPKTKRVANVSFTAHKVAMEKAKDIDQAIAVLTDLARTASSPDKVTVSAVRKAVAIKQGKPPTPAAKKGPGGTGKIGDAIRDLRAGGAQIIAALTPTTTTQELDEVAAGLSKVMAHVERLRAKAARKAKDDAKKPAPAKPSTTPKKAVGARKGGGDLRGL